MVNEMMIQQLDDDTVGDINKGNEDYLVPTTKVKSLKDKLIFLATKRKHRHGKQGLMRWLVDSGATDHMGKNNTDLSNIKKQLTKIITANGVMNSEYRGDVEAIINGKSTKLIRDVLHCHDLVDNLMSVSKLTDDGYSVTFQKDCWFAEHDDQSKNLSGPRMNHLYILDAIPDTRSKSFHATTQDTNAKKVFGQLLNDSDTVITLQNGKWKSINSANGNTQKGIISNEDLLLQIHRQKSNQDSLALKWHARLGHIHLEEMKHLAKSGAIRGFNQKTFDCSRTKLNCNHCIIGKLAKKKIPKSTDNHATKPGERISCDLTGPLKVQTKDGFKYLLTFTDQFSGYRWGFLLKNRSLVPIVACYKQVEQKIFSEHGRKVKYFRSDN
jgi:hypothetical protein